MDDINKLKDILSRSKAIMAKTDTEFGGVGNVSSIDDTPAQTYQEKEIPNLTENYINTQQDRSTRSVSPQNGKYRNLKTTKMPKVVVDAMVNTPIEIPESPYASFELDQLGDLVNESTTTQSTPPDSTTTNVDNIRQIVREEIEDIVRDVVEGYLDKALITEDIQIKIGNTIFSGNLKPLPKKRKTKKRI
jgi:hypothetical protein